MTNFKVILLKKKSKVYVCDHSLQNRRVVNVSKTVYLTLRYFIRVFDIIHFLSLLGNFHILK